MRTGAQAQNLGLSVPSGWAGLLDEGRNHRALLLYWRSLAARVPSISAFLRDKLKQLSLFKENGCGTSLLYAFTIGGNDLNFYKGRPPLAAVPEKFQGLWERIPAD